MQTWQYNPDFKGLLVKKLVLLLIDKTIEKCTIKCCSFTCNPSLWRTISGGKLIMSKPGTGRVLSGALMKQFYQDHAEELLPVFIKKGLEEFCKRFCDLYASQPGQIGSLVTPRQVSPTFNNHFIDHQRFYEIAKSAYEVVGDGSMEEKDIQTFHDLIKESSEFKTLTKSESLNGNERRIMCRMMLPNKIKQSNQQSDIFTEMFAEEAQEIIEPTSEASDTETTLTTSIEVDEEVSIFVRRGQKAKSEERALCLEVMHALIKATRTSAELANVTIALIAQTVLEKHPELNDWVAQNKKWIAKKRSVMIVRQRPKVALSDTEATPVAKTVETFSAEDKQSKATSKKKADRSGKKAKSQERVQALKVVNKFQGKNHKFYNRDEMIAKILAKFPQLEEWFEDKANKNWLSTTLGSIRYKLLGKTTGQAKQVAEEIQQQAPIVPEAKEYKSVEKQTKTPSPAPETSSVENDLLAQVNELISHMKSGMVAPVQIIQRGRKLKTELEDFEAKLLEAKSAFNEVFSSYEKLGIEV